jgi:hypothetical protein
LKQRRLVRKKNESRKYSVSKKSPGFPGLFFGTQPGLPGLRSFE